MRRASRYLAPLALLLPLLVLSLSQPQPAAAWPWGPTHPSALQVLKLLSTRLYGHNDLDAIDDYCEPDVVVHGDGVFLPRTSFKGVAWVRDIHSEWFGQYTGWRFALLEVASGPAAAAGAKKGFTDAFGFFHWSANNTGAYRGLPPTSAVSADYGVLHLVLGASGLVTDVTLWRAGFAEERGALLRQPRLRDRLTPLHDVTQQPFWAPSGSVRDRMLSSAHAVLEVLNQGARFLDSLDDLCSPRVVLVDGGDVFGPGAVQGVPALKQWLGGWLARYGQVAAAVTGVAVTPYSNKVLLSFRLLLVDANSGRSSSSLTSSGGGKGGDGIVAPAAPTAVAAPVDVEGALLYVYNIAGAVTHLVVWRNGTPDEMRARFVGGDGGGGAGGGDGGGVSAS